IAADSAQYPGKMASQGVQTIAQLAKGGSKPSLPAGQDFINTGTTLVTANPLPGLDSQKPEEAAQKCWGGNS
ncbi:MAG: sugar ABC transporter substrate-binding protein, partial [Actinomycetes bacterium]